MKVEIIKAEDYGLTTKQGVEISSKFQILEEEKKVLTSEYSEIITKELTPELSIKAGVLDKKLQKHLKQRKDIHSANKSFFLNGGRFVDSIYNVDKVEFGIMRDATQVIKNFAENLEKERIAELNSKRVSLVEPYVDDITNLFLADMDEDVFEAYLLTKKNNYEAIIAAENKREEERLKAIEQEKAEQDLIRLENAKLKADAEAKEKALEKERKEAKDKQEAIELKARKEREAAEQKAESLRKEQAIKDAKIESELKAKKEAEEQRLQSELNKGDEDKVKDLINDLEALKTKYSFKAVKTQKMYADVGLLIDKVNAHIKK
tara:strand:+ start:655 stop:1614 length:960 start_codon:yes stop_codon:yes gene_type:complete